MYLLTPCTRGKILLHNQIWVCEIDMFTQIRKTFTNVRTHIGNRKTRNWFRYETFIYLFEFKVFWHEESETQFLSMLTFPSDPHHVRPPAANYWSGLGDLQKSTCFVQAQISARHFRAWHHSRPRSHFLSGVFIVIFLIVTSAPRAFEHLHSMCAPN